MMLNAREPKIVNGPQILDKYVGESEANIRYATNGVSLMESRIKMDEIKAIKRFLNGSNSSLKKRQKKSVKLKPKKDIKIHSMK